MVDGIHKDDVVGEPGQSHHDDAGGVPVHYSHVGGITDAAVCCLNCHLEGLHHHDIIGHSKH